MSDSPKILFSDIDGTLLNNNRVLSKNTIKEFNRIKNQVPIILISARMPKAMVYLQEMGNIARFPFIAYNGALIKIDNKIVYSLEIDTTVIQALMKYNSQQKIHFSLYNNDDWYVPTMDYWAKREFNNTKVEPIVKTNKQVITQWQKENKGAHKIMCMGNIDDIDALSDFLEKHYKEHLHIYRSKSTYIEISPIAVSKKTAINFLLENYYLEYSFLEAVAFGDNFNDIEMLKAVGFGVAVANAKSQVKEIAKYVTNAGSEDGVANFIKKYIDFNN